MSKNFIFIFLVLSIGLLAYMLGRKNGSNQVTASVVQNINLVQQIAELSAVSVSGTTTVKLTNKSSSPGAFSRLKDYLVENTLTATLPYEAKFGVDIKNKNIKSDTKGKTITLFLPDCKLLSLQLSLDKMETMNQTGIFASTTIADLGRAQKEMYSQVTKTLSGNVEYRKMARLQITNILRSYYEPLGYNLTCVFDDNAASARP
ncbi:MAG: DUF4230 domain-containing protein [Ferruginibacter sp.]